MSFGRILVQLSQVFVSGHLVSGRTPHLTFLIKLAVRATNLARLHVRAGGVVFLGRFSWMRVSTCLLSERVFFSLSYTQHSSIFQHCPLGHLVQLLPTCFLFEFVFFFYPSSLPLLTIWEGIACHHTSYVLAHVLTTIQNRPYFARFIHINCHSEIFI